MRQHFISFDLHLLQERRLLVIGCFFLLGVVLLLSACSEGDASRGLEAGSADVRLASCFDVVATDEAVHLLFGQPIGSDDDELELFYTRSTDLGITWSDPVLISVEHAPPGRHNRGNDPRLAASADRLMVVWTAKGGGPWGSGPLAGATSANGGTTWKSIPGPSAPGGGPDVGYRFPAVAADGQAFHTVWIHAEGEERSLRHAQLRFEGEHWSEPVVIDPHICACCWNTLRISDDGALVALYRDQDPSDMALAISSDGGSRWEISGSVGAFDWDFNGCPHVGGGLAVGSGEGASIRILASVWTGHPEHAGGYLLESRDSGQSWKRTGELGDGSRRGRNTDIAIGGNGSAAVVWDQPVEGEARQAVFLAMRDGSGSSWSAPRRLSRADEYATHPRVLVMEDRSLVFWTEVADDNSAILRMESITMID